MNYSPPGWDVVYELNSDFDLKVRLYIIPEYIITYIFLQILAKFCHWFLKVNIHSLIIVLFHTSSQNY